MRFQSTEIEGVVVVELDRVTDGRGSFARTFDAEEWRAHGLASDVAQMSVSRNPVRGTLRGLHYQLPPHGEDKIVRCSRGAVYDVAVDLRPGSATFRHWFALELSSENDRMLYIPAGLAHGFLTLCDDCELVYQMAQPYVAEAASGVRWDDPAFGIAWPDAPSVISERDQSYPGFRA